MSKHPYQILIRPLLTEKATNGQEMSNPQYHFQVAPDANKVEIREAVERAFPGVKVSGVNTIRMKGKAKRLRTAKVGYRSTWKKAIVTLEEGQSINLI